MAEWLAYLRPDPAILGSIPSFSKKNSEEKIVDVVKVNQRYCLEESGQWLENVEDASSLSPTQLSSIQ